LAGFDSVGIGFDFFKFILDQHPNMPLPPFDVFFPPNLINHGHTRNVTRVLIERGVADDDIEKMLYANWMRVFGELL
jgi:microsomal dipeptidase-like Zn-dependent dipeptidase